MRSRSEAARSDRTGTKHSKNGHSSARYLRWPQHTFDGQLAQKVSFNLSDKDEWWWTYLKKAAWLDGCVHLLRWTSSLRKRQISSRFRLSSTVLSMLYLHTTHKKHMTFKRSLSTLIGR